MKKKILYGRVCQVQGPVVDVRFGDELPGLRTAIEIEMVINNLLLKLLNMLVMIP